MKSKKALRPRHILDQRARAVGCSLTSIGDVEQLAGVNVNSETERRALWEQFRHLFGAPTQDLFDAVMDHCAAIALRRLEAGELSLVPTRYSGGAW